MIRLTVLGVHTHLESTVCAACPHNTAGCCVSPPPYDWADLGRVVLGGGRAFLLEQLAESRLVRTARGLAIQRVRGRHAPNVPRQKKCGFHGATGCTIAAELRPSTCNYFLCEEAYVEGGLKRGDPDASLARETQEALARRYGSWNRELEARVQARWPEGPTFDGELLDWLAAETAGLAREAPLLPGG